MRFRANAEAAEFVALQAADALNRLVESERGFPWDDPDACVKSHEALAPYVELIREMRSDAAETDKADLVVELLEETLKHAEESVAGEQHALEHIRAGDTGYFPVGKTQAEAEAAALASLARYKHEARLCKEILTAPAGVGA